MTMAVLAKDILIEQETLDTCGLWCPEPIMLVRHCIRKMQASSILKVTATDPSTWRDIPRFCHFIGHTLLDQQKSAQQYIYYIQKKA